MESKSTKKRYCFRKKKWGTASSLPVFSGFFHFGTKYRFGTFWVWFNILPPHFDQVTPESEFFTEYGEANRYQIHEVIGKGSYGVVAAATDTHTGERVAIKKINDVFEHVSDATRILREIKLLRLLRHPDIVEIKHIMLPPSRREFKDIFVVFELMESDLHQVFFFFFFFMSENVVIDPCLFF